MALRFLRVRHQDNRRAQRRRRRRKRAFSGDNMWRSSSRGRFGGGRAHFVATKTVHSATQWRRWLSYNFMFVFFLLLQNHGQEYILYNMRNTEMRGAVKTLLMNWQTFAVLEYAPCCSARCWIRCGWKFRGSACGFGGYTTLKTRTTQLIAATRSFYMLVQNCGHKKICSEWNIVGVFLYLFSPSSFGGRI